jgi:hypothetical protein
MTLEEKIIEEYNKYFCLSSVMQVESQNEIRNWLSQKLQEHRKQVLEEVREKNIKILNAWYIEGICPEYHNKAKQDLKNNWKTLYLAIEDLLQTLIK